MSRQMNFEELQTLLQHIYISHSPTGNFMRGHRVVKYVEPVIDMRDGKCFAIKFQMFGDGDTTLYTQNEQRNNPESLFDRCMSWLDGWEETIIKA